MINAAFASPDRTLTARITIDGIVYGPDVIASIKFNRGVSLANLFEIGTAYAQVVSFELLDEHGTLLEGRAFLGKRARIEIGVLDGELWAYQDMGEYILEAPEKVQKTLWRFDGSDDMIRADISFDETLLVYPQTILAIFQSAVTQMGMTTDTTLFPNSAVLIDIKPIFYDMTIREVLSDVAELAAGYCFIEDGQVRIKSMVQDTLTSVTGENISSFRRHEDKDILIDQLIIRQTGTTDHIEGTGTHPYYIADNVFIQGDPQRFAPAIFGAINEISFVPCEVEFNGNPTELLNGWIDLDFLGIIYRVFPTAREISFTGGMKERWISNHLENKPPDPVEENLVRNIKKTQAMIQLTNSNIEMTVTQIVTEQVQQFAPYQVHIISTGGLLFKNGVISTTLLARVYQNNADVTDEIDANRFRWTKTNADGSPDTIWNDAHFGGVKQVQVASEDIKRRATFQCQILDQ
ncbi:hypothetical protein [Proteiniclasticum sp. QWL-01]|uniref:hypothetical protein n=1 Tax=Proteiniclasticum sp. QWL-01 TaxID=3036945 RepID=UPI00240F968C|nr:hypothetical protein [Proteiniclasticum sp. QWL-01]WFF72667.1 hypothetical protein P6M73_15565 [Proteiniclasticum sp. QWL-01]